MEIQVNTRLRKDNRFEFDFHITGMDMNRLPLFNADELREMARPQVAAILRNHASQEEVADELSHHIAYGSDRSQSAS